ncbi:MAG TPA: NUDIX hydrolase [Candidatus Bathyarchaeia archaeon]|nr:NUDIX hydrolase [Candidatus Bathyarchaeia archaeon]
MVKRLYPDHPLVGVGAIIICNGKILLEKRGNEPGKGKWSIPGGLVELGETVEQTVIREVKEETGLEVEKPEHIDVVDNIDLDENGRIKYHFIIIDFLVKLKSGILKAASDAAEVRWVLLSEVEKYELTKTFRAFYERNRQKLAKLNSCL